MNNLNENIKKEIQKNLSEMVGNELKQYIADLEKKALEFEDLQKKYNEAYETNQNQVQTIKSLNQTIDQYKDIEKREKAVVSKEVELDLKYQVLEVKEECAILRISDIKGLAQDVFRSPRMEKWVNDSETFPNPNYNKIDPSTGSVDYNQYSTNTKSYREETGVAPKNDE